MNEQPAVKVVGGVRMYLGTCGHYHEDEEPCRHGQVTMDGFTFGDTVPEHKQDTKYGPHIAAQCGWCLLYGNAQPIERDSRRCLACQAGDHGLCTADLEHGCGCACSHKAPTVAWRKPRPPDDAKSCGHDLFDD